MRSVFNSRKCIKDSCTAKARKGMYCNGHYVRAKARQRKRAESIMAPDLVHVGTMRVHNLEKLCTLEVYPYTPDEVLTAIINDLGAGETAHE